VASVDPARPLVAQKVYANHDLSPE
jgi:hypothetical protein